MDVITLCDPPQWASAEESYSPNTEHAHAVLESIGDAVITTDTMGTITYLNPVAQRLTGWAGKEALGQSLTAVLNLISEASRQPVANTAARCMAEARSVDLEDGVLLVRRDGTEVPIGDSAAPVPGPDGTTVGVVLVIRDESEKRRVGHQLSYEATHDPLTDLINRREFERRLTRTVTDLTSAASEHVLLLVDLDRFKQVNDTWGHAAGDDLLRSLGPLLHPRLRKGDTLARLGGDEFGVLLENCPLAEAVQIAESLRGEIERCRFHWGQTGFSIGASIGLVPVTAEPGGIPALLRAADAACYAAKNGGGDRVRLGPRVTRPARSPRPVLRLDRFRSPGVSERGDLEPATEGQLL